MTSAVRGRQMHFTITPYLVSFLVKGRTMDARDTRLFHGVLFRNYFTQFEAVAAAKDGGYDINV